MNQQRDSCPFCAPTIHEDTFLESPRFRAIYNVAPILPGHSLVIPKWHAASLLELTDDEATELTLFSRSVVQLLLDVFAVEAFNWTIQDGAAAGQTVGHLHLHLIPRTPGDLPAPGEWYPRLRRAEGELIDGEQRERLSSTERREIVERIRRAARDPHRRK